MSKDVDYEAILEKYRRAVAVADSRYTEALRDYAQRIHAALRDHAYATNSAKETFDADMRATRGK